MAVAPKTTLRGQPRRRRSKVQPWKWAQIRPRFEELYKGEEMRLPLKKCIPIIEEELDFKALPHQYVRQIKKWNLPKYTKTRKSPRRVMERTAQDELERQLAPISVNRLHEPHQLEDQTQEEYLEGGVHNDDASAFKNSNYAIYPQLYAPSTAEAHGEPYWALVGNGAILMEQDQCSATDPCSQMPSSSYSYQSESTIPFRSHITSQSPLPVIDPTSINNHPPLVTSHAPCVYSEEDLVNDPDIGNNTWHSWQSLGTRNNSYRPPQDHTTMTTQMYIRTTEISISVCTCCHQP